MPVEIATFDAFDLFRLIAGITLVGSIISETREPFL